VLALVLGAAVVGALDGWFADLVVYRYGGRGVLDGVQIYAADDPTTGYPFTYPPFGAILMVPLALLPLWVSAGLLTGASVGALAGAVVVVRRSLGRPTPGWLIVIVTLAALALEPVWQNLTFGQINTLVMAAVLVDLLGPQRRWSGVLVGMAAAVKLTPLVFVVLLLLVGRRTAAGRAAVTFAGTVAIGFLVMPGSAATYWTEDLVDGSRVGPPALAHNQSAYGAMTRLLDEQPSTVLWLLVAGPTALVIVLVAAAWWRRGDRVLATCLAGLATLVASPVSWSHHWVWAVPVALVLWERSRWAAGAWTAVFVARPILWPPWGRGREYGWDPLDHLVGNSDLLAALAVSCGAAAALSWSRWVRVLGHEVRSLDDPARLLHQGGEDGRRWSRDHPAGRVGTGHTEDDMERGRDMEADLFAGVAVSDLERAVGWFDRLFGEVETFEPNDTEKVWTIAEHRHVYVVLSPASAGHAKVTLFAADFEGFLAAAAGRGISPESQETYDNGVRKAIYRDPDGNEIGVGGPADA